MTGVNVNLMKDAQLINLIDVLMVLVKP